MNIIEVYGGTSETREFATRVAEWCIEQLLPRHYTLDITIELGKVDGAQGYCLTVDKKTYELEIDDGLKGDEFLTCLMHEMVHVKQGVKGEDICEDEAYDMEKKLLTKYKG